MRTEKCFPIKNTTINNHFEKIEKIKMTKYKVNIALIGDNNIGKRDMKRRFCCGILTVNYFPEEPGETYSRRIEIDERTIDFHVTDIPVEAFRNVKDERVIKANGFMLMYSINNRESFLSLHQFHNRIVETRGTSDIPIVVVGNKCDLQNERVVSTEEGRTFAQSINAPFFETSAKTEININEPFEEIVRLFCSFGQMNHQKKEERNCLIC